MQKDPLKDCFNYRQFENTCPWRPFVTAGCGCRRCGLGLVDPSCSLPIIAGPAVSKLPGQLPIILVNGAGLNTVGEDRRTL